MSLPNDLLELFTSEFNKLENYVEFSDNEIITIQRAKSKFKIHCENILNSINESLDYCFSDEFLTEEIEANEVEFLISGEQY